MGTGEGCRQTPLRVDAALLDAFNLPRAYWEAKEENDDLREEMNKKIAAGYPRTNILYQKPTHAIVMHDGRIAFPNSGCRDHLTSRKSLRSLTPMG